MKRVVNARFRKIPRKGDGFSYFVIFCGSGSDCADDVAQVREISWPADENLFGPDMEGFAYAGHTEEGVLTAYDLRLGLRGFDLAKAEQISPYPGSGEWLQIWVATNRSGLYERDDGDYEIIRSRSRIWTPWRIGSNHRPSGRRPLPSALANRVRDQSGADDGDAIGLGSYGNGVIGAVPVLPANIRCPLCGAFNHIGPMAFNGGGWRML